MYQNRVTELVRVRVGDLKPNPLNWRMHPESQQNALRSVLAKIGLADAVLVRRGDSGDLQLIDGHLRAETLHPDDQIPALVLDVTEDEASKILLTLDSLAGMASIDTHTLDRLVKDIKIDEPAVQAMIDKLLSGGEWQGPAPIDPDQLPEYDPESETVSIRIAHVPRNRIEEVANKVAAVVKDCGLAYAVESK